jgi:surface protein
MRGFLFLLGKLFVVVILLHITAATYCGACVDTECSGCVTATSATITGNDGVASLRHIVKVGSLRVTDSDGRGGLKRVAFPNLVEAAEIVVENVKLLKRISFPRAGFIRSFRVEDAAKLKTIDVSSLDTSEVFLVKACPPSNYF